MLQYFAVVISTLLLASAMDAQLGDRDNPLVGSVSGHVYTNDIFRLTYTFPAEWIVEERPSQGSVDAIAMFNAQIGPVQHPSASIALSAETIGATGSLDASGYLDSLERSLTANIWQKTAPQGVPHGRGTMWTRRDFTSSSDTSEFSKLAVLVAPSHGYMLRLFYWAKTPSDLESAVNTLDGLKMNPDWSDRPDDAEDAVPPASGKRVRISSGLLAANCTYMVNPEYPKQARDAGVHGGVFLRVLLGTDGAVKRLYVLEGDPLLAQAAIDAVHQWTYKPYLLNGQPVEVVSVLWVEFK